MVFSGGVHAGKEIIKNTKRNKMYMFCDDEKVLFDDGRDRETFGGDDVIGLSALLDRQDYRWLTQACETVGIHFCEGRRARSRSIKFSLFFAVFLENAFRIAFLSVESL